MNSSVSLRTGDKVTKSKNFYSTKVNNEVPLNHKYSYLKALSIVMDAFDWDSFWKDQKQSFNDVMRISTTYFAIQLEKLFAIKPGNEILDYGCGPGFLADYLETKKILITGADINPLFIEQSKKNHPASLFMHITTDAAVNKKIFEENIKAKKFDFIVLLSITQYFRNGEEVANVISMLLPYLKENGKVIIADVIDPNTSSRSDVVSVLLHCVKNGKAMAFFRFMFYLFFSSYRKLTKNVKLLRLSALFMAEVANRNLLNCKQVKGLTIHSSRTNYILTRMI